jgi:hypothetical protein
MSKLVNQVQAIRSQLKSLGCDTDIKTIQGFLDDRGIGAGEVDDDLLFEMADKLSQSAGNITTQAQSPAPPTQVRKPRKPRPVTATGDRQLDAVISHAKAVVTDTAQVSAQIIAAIPAAIEYETSALVTANQPQIDADTAATVQAINDATEQVIGANRAKATEFLNRYGVTA